MDHVMNLRNQYLIFCLVPQHSALLLEKWFLIVSHRVPLSTKTCILVLESVKAKIYDI